MYSVKHSQVRSCLIRLNACFHVNFIEFFFLHQIKDIKNQNCALNSMKNRNVATPEEVYHISTIIKVILL